jgi:hypothetical protein
MNYDFSILSPVEFEILSRDLIQKEFDVNFETFGQGRDGGIDLRYSMSENIILQCKRFKNFSSLYQNLKKEFPKVIKLEPDRYLISTSVSLNPFQKEKIIKLFKPYVKFSQDIYGKEDLNNLLSQNPEIEKRHYKLWLSSSTVLDSILHSQVFNQSKFIEDEIIEKIGLYVQNDYFNEALSILKAKKYVIISGNPGVGKTTLAEMLVYHLLASGVSQFIYLSDSIKQGFEMFSEGISQVFLFDDFLGRNFLENKLPTNEEKMIVKFIERIEKFKNKFLVFTTREYILNQASEKFEEFQFKEFSKCILDIGKYNIGVKAYILYNHLYVNKIPFKFIETLLEDGHIFEILNHQSFNPRIIEAFTKTTMWSKWSHDEFPKKVLELFDAPYLVWKNAFEIQITPLSRIILINLLIIGEEIEHNELYNQIENYFKNNNIPSSVILNNFSFSSSLRELENSFIEILRKYDSKLFIKFQNPSIHDFLVEYFSENKILREPFLNSFRYLKNFLPKLKLKVNSNDSKKIRIEEEEYIKLKEYLVTNFDILKYMPSHTYGSKFNSVEEHILKLSTCYFELDGFDRDFTRMEFSKIVNSDQITYRSRNDFLYLLENFYDELDFDPLELIRVIGNTITSYDELDSFYQLRSLYSECFEDYKQTYKEEFEDVLIGLTTDILNMDFYEDYEYDELKFKLEEIESEFNFPTEWEKRELKAKYDLILKRNQEQLEQDLADLEELKILNNINEINPLEALKKINNSENVVGSSEWIMNLFSSLK